MSAATEQRRVRIVLEGIAHSVNGLIRVDVGTTLDRASLLVNPAWPGVAMEEVPEPRVWNDGDVVQHSEDTWTLTRERGQWLSTRQPDRPGYWTDDKVTAHLVDEGAGWGRLVVLRYQHGEA